MPVEPGRLRSLWRHHGDPLLVTLCRGCPSSEVLMIIVIGGLLIIAAGSTLSDDDTVRFGEGSVDPTSERPEL